MKSEWLLLLLLVVLVVLEQVRAVPAVQGYAKNYQLCALLVIFL